MVKTPLPRLVKDLFIVFTFLQTVLVSLSRAQDNPVSIDADLFWNSPSGAVVTGDEAYCLFPLDLKIISLSDPDNPQETETRCIPGFSRIFRPERSLNWPIQPDGCNFSVREICGQRSMNSRRSFPAGFIA